MSVIILFNIITFLLYLFSPNEYSHQYCLLLSTIFCANSIITYRLDTQRDFPGFHVLFSVAFFCVSYLYPLFIYGIDSGISLYALASYSNSIITKATALATFAYSIYCTGYIHQLRKNVSDSISHFTYSWPNQTTKKVLYITIAFFVLFIFLGGLDFYASMYNKESGDSSGLSKYVVIILQCFIIITSMLYLYNENFRKRIIVTLVAISCIIILSGSRTLPLFTFLLLGYVICYVHKIRKLYICIALIAGVLAMSVIGMVRSDDVFTGMTNFNYESSEIGHFDVLFDLIVCNRNLYAAYDIVEKDSCTFGLTFVGPLLAPVPFLQSIFMKMANVPADYLNSAAFLTRYELGAVRSVGLGTHIVADVYLAFGLIGLILFYYLGRIVVYARTKMKKNDPVWSIIYLIMFAGSVYLTRASALNDLRYVCWALLIYYLLLRKSSNMTRCE